MLVTWTWSFLILFLMVPYPPIYSQNLYRMFLEVDCLQLEVNPLAETPQGKVPPIE